MKTFFFALSIFLLALNTVSGKNATQNDVEDAKNRVKTFIDCYGKHFQQTIDEIPSLVAESVAKINENAKAMAKVMYDKYFTNLRNSEVALQKGLNENIETNKTECFNMLIGYETNGFSTLEETRDCLLLKIEEVNSYIATVQKDSASLLEKYFSFKTEADNCANREDCNRNEMLSCIIDVDRKATSFMINDMNKGYRVIFDMNENILKNYGKFSDCETEKLIDLNNSEIADQVDKCANNLLN